MPNVPYEPKPIGGLTVNGGGSGYWAWDIPSRCIIHRLVVEQTDGVIVDFDVELYSVEEAAAGQGQSDSAGSDRGELPPSMYKVGYTHNGIAGYMEYNSDKQGNGYGIPFFSQEKGRLGNLRRIYLVIKPQGTGQKKFAAALGLMTME